MTGVSACPRPSTASTACMAALRAMARTSGWRPSPACRSWPVTAAVASTTASSRACWSCSARSPSVCRATSVERLATAVPRWSKATALALDVPRSIPMTTGGTADTEAIVEFVRLARLLALLEAAPDEPEHGRPQTYEQGTSLGVAALVLVDGLGADPQRAADEDRSQRADVGMLAAESQRADRLDHHWILLCRLVPASSARMLGAVVGTGESGRLAGLPPGTGCSGREAEDGTQAEPAAACGDRVALAVGHGADVLALPVAHHASAPHRGGRLCAGHGAGAGGGGGRRRAAAAPGRHGSVVPPPLRGSRRASHDVRP